MTVANEKSKNFTPAKIIALPEDKTSPAPIYGSPPVPVKSSPAQVAEVTNPSLSRDSFKVGDYEIPIRILPYSTEKKMVLALEPMIKKIVGLLDVGEKKEGEKAKTIYDVLKENGVSLITEFADELFSVLHIICQKYQPEITREYIEDNLNLYAAWSALVKQAEKNQMGDLVTSFFYKLATLLPKMSTKAESPES